MRRCDRTYIGLLFTHNSHVCPENFSSVDWHSFVPVETIEFIEADSRLDLPSTITIKQLQALSLTEKRAGFLSYDRAGNLMAASSAVYLPEGQSGLQGNDMMDDDDVEMEVRRDCDFSPRKD